MTSERLRLKGYGKFTVYIKYGEGLSSFCWDVSQLRHLRKSINNTLKFHSSGMVILRMPRSATYIEKYNIGVSLLPTFANYITEVLQEE